MKPLFSQSSPSPSCLLLLLTAFMLVLPVCLGGKVLVVPMDGSHWVNMDFFLRALHERGHTITVLRSSKSWYVKEGATHYSTITVPVTGGFNHDFVHPFILRSIEAQRSGSYVVNFVRQMSGMFDTLENIHRIMSEMAKNILEDQSLLQTLEKSKFDLILTDPCIGTGIILAHHLNLPLVYNVRWITSGEGHLAIAPSPMSYIPMNGLGFSDKMNLLERTMNMVIYFLTDLHYRLSIQPHYQVICDRFFSPKVDFYELLQDADIWLMRVDFVFEFPRPTMPNVVYMGGFQCVPAKPLPKDLEQFVQSSGEHGVIIMSLGTMVKDLPEDITEEIAFAFAQLPQKVLWKHTGHRPLTLGNNTLLVDWIPQNDLLGHPKVKLFVAHGGTNGVQEAIYHGVPVVGLPLFYDQLDNLVRLKARGAARILAIGSLDRTIFLHALQEVLHEPSYRSNMKRLSRLHLDQPMKPLDRALFWTEFVMRHKGAGHLRTESSKMPFYLYNSVDVALYIWGVSLAVPLLLIILVRCLCARVCIRVRKGKTD